MNVYIKNTLSALLVMATLIYICVNFQNFNEKKSDLSDLFISQIRFEKEMLSFHRNFKYQQLISNYPQGFRNFHLRHGTFKFSKRWAENKFGWLRINNENNEVFIEFMTLTPFRIGKISELETLSFDHISPPTCGSFDKKGQCKHLVVIATPSVVFRDRSSTPWIIRHPTYTTRYIYPK